MPIWRAGKVETCLCLRLMWWSGVGSSVPAARTVSCTPAWGEGQTTERTAITQCCAGPCWGQQSGGSGSRLLE